ncbi:hypothetical protein ACZ90_63005 [Streptomyces albus subsp. albus]|nr:hypothetical protein ACZ90_63005 [Streptomyces albus subsp. albus]
MGGEVFDLSSDRHAQAAFGVPAGGSRQACLAVQATTSGVGQQHLLGDSIERKALRLPGGWSVEPPVVRREGQVLDA